MTVSETGPDDGPVGGLDLRDPEERPRKGGSGRGLRLLVLTLVLLTAVFAGGRWGVAQLKDAFGSAPDYPGPGSGQVLFEVHSGDSSAAIGRNLKAQHVVKSVDAFLEQARGNPKADRIQVGFYRLKQHMKASAALGLLLDPKNLVQALVTVREGARVDDVVREIVQKTDFTAQQIKALLQHPARIGLPPEAGGNPEGYLYPATYSVPPKSSPVALLRQMVAKTREVEQKLDIAARARARGMTVEQVMTMASILEYEGQRDADLPKIARVFYNRLAKGMALQSDATVAYANKLTGTVWTTAAQRAKDSAYNTYQHPGLPPGPIGSPGVKTLEAVLDPADGPWLYFVPINLRTGETAFATTLAQHTRNVEKLKAWCHETHSDNCH